MSFLYDLIYDVIIILTAARINAPRYEPLHRPDLHKRFSGRTRRRDNHEKYRYPQSYVIRRNGAV